jgi:hypothetical protein
VAYTLCFSQVGLAFTELIFNPLAGGNVSSGSEDSLHLTRLIPVYVGIVEHFRGAAGAMTSREL